MRARLYTAFRQVGEDLFHQRLISATAGNFSVRTKEGFLITRSGAQKARLAPEDLVEVPLEGPFPEGASVESVVHREVYLKTPARAIVHAHPRVAVALSLRLERLVPVDLEGQHYLNEVPVLSPKTTSATEEAALAVAEALKAHRACLLRGHGAFAIGLKERPEEALLEAYSLLTTLEESAEILFYHRLWGGRMKVLFAEGKDREALLALARELPHPYWLLEGERVWLLEVYGAGEEVERKAKALPGLKVWVFRLRDGVVYRGCGKRSATSP